MASRAANMSTLDIPQTRSERPALARKLVLLFLLVIVTGLGLALLLERRLVSSPLLLAALADLGLGLVAGFSARIILRRQTPMLRTIAPIVAILAGLVVLGWFTDWQAGFGPLRFGRNSVDWLGLIQVALGTSVAWLALRAWQRPSQVGERVTPSPAGQPAPRPKRRTQKHPRPVISPINHPALPAVVSQKPTKSKRRRTRQKSHLRLLSAEEHRCPYCLELVEPNAQRGVVECKVCHTLHHADCWAITGACQVPHYNA